MKEKIDISEFSGMLYWCMSNLGTSHFQRNLPKIKIDENLHCKGQYEAGSGNIISINLKNHTSYLDLCDTFIHEYTHYLQDMDNFMIFYEKFNKTYENHPYEIEARNVAKKYKKELKRWMKN